MTKTWFTAYKRITSPESIFNFLDTIRLDQPKGVYYADPFIIDGYLFVEEFDQKKGFISAARIGDKPEKVLEEPYHLSYPAIFKHNDIYYMTPESGANQTIDLYATESFPTGWQKIKTLIHGKVTADPQTYFDGNNWYLFFTTEDNKLEIYKTDNLFGDWKLHHMGEYLYSRSAGQLFKYEGKLLRPCQYNKDIYGQGIVLKEITLEPYTERMYRHIYPDWYPSLIGTHTINFDGKFVVTDGKINL